MNSIPKLSASPNVLQRAIEAQVPNQPFVGEATAIWTNEDWQYLAVCLDLFSSWVVGR